MDETDVDLTPPEEQKRKSKKQESRSRGRRSSVTIRQENIGLNDDGIGKASWFEVCQNCFVHSPEEWFKIGVGIILLAGVLYFFGLGLELLGRGASVMTSCLAGDILDHKINPVSGVMMGVMATALLQTSTTVTAIVVVMVSASSISVEDGIYVIMGSNIGTTLTNTIVALGQFGNPEQLDLAFAAATIHDIFNCMTVVILLPLEVMTGYLDKLSEALVRGADPEDGEPWEGPARKWISPVAARLLVPNREVTRAVAKGGSCNQFYPIVCADPDNPTKESCTQVGLIGCDSDTGDCPAFFDAQATREEDRASGFVVFAIGLVLIFSSSFVMIRLLSHLFTGVSVRVIYKATNVNGYILIALGAGITILLQSSSMATSFLTPVVGMGALRLEQMLPLTIGANLGTTIASLLTALVIDGNEALQLTLAQMMFNVTGMLLWFPIPSVRSLPVEAARRLGRFAKVWRGFPLLYILLVFFILPLILLGLSDMINSDSKGKRIGGGFLAAFLGMAILYWINWTYSEEGGEQCFICLSSSRATADAKATLPTDIDRAKRQVRRLQIHAGLRTSVGKEEEGCHEPSHEADHRSVELAVRTVASDMSFVKTGLSMLYYHTGLNEDGDGDSSETPEHSLGARLGECPQGDVSLVKLFTEEMPLLFRLVALVTMSLLVWALVHLFSLDGKAGVGGASVVCILIGMGLIYFISLWGSFHGRQDILEFMRNHRLRSQYCKSLPSDMMVIKTGVKELLAFYNLTLSEEECTLDPRVSSDRTTLDMDMDPV